LKHLVIDADDEQTLRRFWFDSDKKTVRVGLYVWDSDGLTWVKMVQPSISVDADDLTVTMGDVEKLLANNYWKDARFDYTSGDLDYKGLNTTHKAATSATSWYVWKFTYSGGELVRMEGPLTGSWDNRASLAWGA